MQRILMEIQFFEIQFFEIQFFEIQFFEIQFFEQTMKRNEKPIKTIKMLKKLNFDALSVLRGKAKRQKTKRKSQKGARRK